MKITTAEVLDESYYNPDGLPVNLIKFDGFPDWVQVNKRHDPRNENCRGKLNLGITRYAPEFNDDWEAILGHLRASGWVVRSWISLSEPGRWGARAWRASKPWEIRNPGQVQAKRRRMQEEFDRHKTTEWGIGPEAFELFYDL